MSLKNEDLVKMILPVVSIDEFEPKAGKEEDVIVVAFYLLDKDPAEDLNTFIQRSYINILDAEVSPNTDKDGNYLVFVELNRDKTFPDKFVALVKDIENVSGKLKWKVRTYLSDSREFDLSDPMLFDFVASNPDEYTTKDEFMKTSKKEEISEFLQDSHLLYLTFDNNNVILGTGSRQMVAEVVDVGEYDAVINRNFLAESAFRLFDKPIEATVLNGMLGNYDVLPIDSFLCVSRQSDGTIMLLRDTEIKYKG
jgi:hypothetical protein